MKIRSGRDTFLVAGVPLNRGTPIHLEDGLNMTDFDKKTNKVTHIHTTPGNPVVRIHELMHARHTNPKRFRRVYAGLPDVAANVLEDARLHAKHWPWRRDAYYHKTPKRMIEAVDKLFAEEIASCDKHVEEDPKVRGSFPDFAVRLRAVAVRYGDTREYHASLSMAGFARDQKELADKIMRALIKDRENSATKMLKAVFFPPTPPVKLPPWLNGPPNTEGHGEKVGTARDGFAQPDMEIIELQHTVPVDGTSQQTRRATMGSRLHRPSLRKPILPRRLFVRRTIREKPIGTILIDASGSMGEMETVERWLNRAPYGTIAYYAGGNADTGGQLFIYARDGRKAPEVVAPDYRGNLVDGPAMDWLLQQPGPRLFITDREFCGATDSYAQAARLTALEAAGEIIVEDYSQDEDE